MLKFLPVVLVILLAAAFYFRSSFSWPGGGEEKTPVSLNALPAFTPQETNGLEGRVGGLEQTVTLLVQRANELSKTSNGQSQGVTKEELQALQTVVNELKVKIAQLEQKQTVVSATTNTTATTTTKAPVYIPLGGGGSTGNQNWSTDNVLYQVSLDPVDFSGYTGIQLETTLRLNEMSGEAQARIYNLTDNSEVSGSGVSTNSNKNSLVTSASFKLPSGRKTYGIQLRSTTGTESFLQTARLKVSF